ncbi:accessory gene regulator B family protein [Butyrivibrio sp. INlla14]|uniref:accessory gene regulator B family protein n=1 Tax=Butyrivibrio sp. INlla14 TaxID=1520808 RepID=UPI00115FDF15|nr:accessory gene regulator B family protein [Butyrivibrio sp. INlla14]
MRIEKRDYMGFNDEEMEVAIYGLKRLGMFTASLIVVLIIGIIMDNVKGVFLFLVLFIPLRIFAGGLHMPKLWICAITSALLIVGVAYVLNCADYTLLHQTLCLAIAILSAVQIILLAPVDTANKPLFKEEKIRYKKISIIITMMETALFFSNFINDLFKMLIFMVLVIEGFYLTVQKVVNYMREKRNRNDQIINE